MRHAEGKHVVVDLKFTAAQHLSFTWQPPGAAVTVATDLMAPGTQLYCPAVLEVTI